MTSQRSRVLSDIRRRHRPVSTGPEAVIRALTPPDRSDVPVQEDRCPTCGMPGLADCSIDVIIRRWSDNAQDAKALREEWEALHQDVATITTTAAERVSEAKALLELTDRYSRAHSRRPSPYRPKDWTPPS